MNLLRSVCRHLAATLLLLVSLLVGGASASAGHPLVLVGTSTLASSDAGVQDPDLQLRPEVTHVAREASGAHARGRTRGARPSEVAADQARSLVTSDVAAEAGTSGGAAAVRLGQAGEDAVRGAYDIGPKFTADIGGRTRIFDGLSNEAVSEVKNVASQAYTQQLKDSLAYAQGNGLRFDLYVRPDTYLTGPLRDAISGGFINLRYIP